MIQQLFSPHVCFCTFRLFTMPQPSMSVNVSVHQNTTNQSWTSTCLCMQKFMLISESSVTLWCSISHSLEICGGWVHVSERKPSVLTVWSCRFLYERDEKWQMDEMKEKQTNKTSNVCFIDKHQEMNVQIVWLSVWTNSQSSFDS